MNQELVSRITLPDDGVLAQRDGNYTRSARELVTGKAEQTEVEFVIDNFGEAVAAAHDDFCCNGNDRHYFKIDAGREIFEMTFDLASLRHCFGIFGNDWQFTDLTNQLKRSHPQLQSVVSDRRLTWMDKLERVYHPSYKAEIINSECSDRNARIQKLNWQKMMLKIFTFINIGKLEDRTTFFYKEERNAHSYGNPHYLLVRSLRNGELEDISNKNSQYYDKELVIVLVEEQYNGQRCLTPESIYIDGKSLYSDGSRNKGGSKEKVYQGRKYKYSSTPTITRLNGGKYANKGSR